jgi:hypothetical protein
MCFCALGHGAGFSYALLAIAQDFLGALGLSLVMKNFQHTVSVIQGSIYVYGTCILGPIMTLTLFVNLRLHNDHKKTRL